MKHKKLLMINSSIVLIIVVALLVVGFLLSKHIIKNSLQAFAMPLVDQSTLGELSKKSGSTANTDRVDKTIIPPTDSWISGMVLQKIPLPVYPMPLSFLAKDSGFEIGLPDVQSTANAITGEHNPGIVATIGGATGFHLSRYDKVSASLTYVDQSQQLGTLTLAEGSPYVFYRAQSNSSLHITGISSIFKDSTDSYLHYEKSGHGYIVDTHDGANVQVTGAQATVTAPKGSLVTLYALPANQTDSLQEFSGNELGSVSVAYTTTSDGLTQTKLTYQTTNNNPTVFVPMSYSQVLEGNTVPTTYASIYGPMQAMKGTNFTASVKTVQPANELDLSHLSNVHKQQLLASLPDDIANTAITANDSYYAGKQLARAATLLGIAEQLGQAKESTQLKTILKDAFSKRLNGQYFYYDPTLKGIAAKTNAFGSEDFNDHHFHYGYFIYAASILAKYDATFLKDSQKQINLLVADIASYAPSASFPVRRYYDPYAEHSWAAGLAPFADGNNQESSSEAINAWNGVALWAKLTGNDQLQSSATWMLSNEAATAKTAWRSVNTTPAYLKNFTGPLASLNFGGKRTYSTFFSNEPNAKLGIQLIPMSPFMLSYASDGSNISATISDTIKNDNYNVSLGDYVLMYLALSQPHKAEQLLNKQQNAFIDDGNSRTYLDAWVFSLTDTSKK